MSLPQNIEVGFESFKRVEEELKEELEKLMSLKNRNAPSIRTAIQRRKNALHQLLEWKDFLMNPQYYDDERGKRMKRLLETLIDFRGKKRVRRLQIALIRKTYSGFNLAIRLKAEKKDRILLSVEYGLNDHGEIIYYYD